MKKFRVFGRAVVGVSVLIDAEDDEELTKEEICDRAMKNFGGIRSFSGNGGADKLIGVTGHDEAIFADEEIEFDDYEEEE